MILPLNSFPWPLSLTGRTPSSGRWSSRPRIGKRRARNTRSGQLNRPEIVFFPYYLLQQPFAAATLPRIEGLNLVDDVCFGGRSDEVSDERNWKIATTGCFDSDWRDVTRGLRRACGDYSQPGCSGFETSDLGMATGAGQKRSKE